MIYLQSPTSDGGLTIKSREQVSLDPGCYFQDGKRKTGRFIIYLYNHVVCH